MGKIYAIVSTFFCLCLSSSAIAGDGDLSFGKAASFKIDAEQLNNDTQARRVYYDEVKKFTLSNPNEVSNFVNDDAKLAFVPETLDKDCLKNKILELQKQDSEVLNVTTGLTARNCNSAQDVAHFSITYYLKKQSLMPGIFGRLLNEPTRAELECPLTTRNTPCIH